MDSGIRTRRRTRRNYQKVTSRVQERIPHMSINGQSNMKAKALWITAAIMMLYAPAAMGQRYITFTDADGIKQTHELSTENTTTIFTHRPDGRAEAVIGYHNGALTVVSTHRPDNSTHSVGSTEAIILYEDGALTGYKRSSAPTVAQRRKSLYKGGALFAVRTRRTDDRIEAIIGYKNGALDSMGTLRPDGKTEAQITYQHGRIESEYR